MIDEIEKMPALLNTVQLMIEEHGIRVFLTESSERALRLKSDNFARRPSAFRRATPAVTSKSDASNTAWLHDYERTVSHRAYQYNVIEYGRHQTRERAQGFYSVWCEVVLYALDETVHKSLALAKDLSLTPT